MFWRAPANSTPSFDQAISANNGAGASSYTISATTSGTNRLLLLTFTYRTADLVSCAPDAGISWTSLTGNTQGTVTTEIYYSLATSQLTNTVITLSCLSLQTYNPKSTKSSAVLISFSGVDTGGTNGSEAIDNFNSTGNNTANPSLAITPVNGGLTTLVIGFLGGGNDSPPTAGTGFTLRSSGANSGGAPSSRTVTAVETSNSGSTGGGSVTVPFTRAANDWNQFNVVLKGQ